MLKKRIIISLTFVDGVLFRTKKFKPDYRYTKNFVDMWEADEIILTDISRNKKLTNKFFEVVNFFCENCFLPITVGGGIKSLEDAKIFFKIGADKILLNSSSFTNPDLITEIKNRFGSQAIIHSLDYKKNDKGVYQVFIDDGVKCTNLSPQQWAKKIISYGAGEIILNDIENDGSLMGYNIEFLKEFSSKIHIPLIALGGAGKWEHLLDLFAKTSISAAATQNIFHFTNESLNILKKYLKSNNILVRS